MQWQGKPLIEHVLSRLNASNHIIINANRNIDTLQVGQAGGINFASGLLDLLGIHPVESGCVWDDPWAAIEKLVQDIPVHPYARLGVSMIRHAMEEFTTFMGQAGQPYLVNPDRNARVITPVGTVKTTYAVPKTMARGVEAFEEKKPCLLVGFQGLKGFSVRQIVETLGDRWPTLRAVTIPFPDMSGEIYCEQLARSLEIMSVCRRLASSITEHLGDAQVVGLPAVLGVSRTIQVRAALEQALGLPVFEVPTMIPGATGLRLREAFEQHLPGIGVRAFYQNRVLGIERREDGSFLLQVGGGQTGVFLADEEGNRIQDHLSSPHRLGDVVGGNRYLAEPARGLAVDVQDLDAPPLADSLDLLDIPAEQRHLVAGQGQVRGGHETAVSRSQHRYFAKLGHC